MLIGVGKVLKQHEEGKSSQVSLRLACQQKLVRLDQSRFDGFKGVARES